MEKKGKVAIVTGSSKGIGKAIALSFAKSNEYSAVVINSRKAEEAQQVSEELKKLGCKSIAIEADVWWVTNCRRKPELLRLFYSLGVLGLSMSDSLMCGD